jgi:hypothetical protein
MESASHVMALAIAESAMAVGSVLVLKMKKIKQKTRRFSCTNCYFGECSKLPMRQ